ncbi:MAG: hypothetical protein ACK4V2_02300 [Pseudomonadota bacterium]|jgi:hypothetical protein|nr:hypothetical protein [Alphaproteobacteria bacterium]
MLKQVLAILAISTAALVAATNTDKPAEEKVVPDTKAAPAADARTTAPAASSEVKEEAVKKVETKEKK